MIREIIKSNIPIEISAPVSGKFSYYLFQLKGVILYSTSITEILNDSRVKDNLRVSSLGVSFLLRNGVIPSPNTIYEDLFILQVGDSLKINENDLKLAFQHEFPYSNSKRKEDVNIEEKSLEFLELIAEETNEQINKSSHSNSFLFHSAGKDSNSIALALAESGDQDRVSLITQKSKGKFDESEISKGIAKKLGFKHLILNEIDDLSLAHKLHIENYFEKMPFPVVDSVTIAYPLYHYQNSDIADSNLIFGDGNDGYLYSLPSKRQKLLYDFSTFNFMSGILRNTLQSESILSPLQKTKLELFGLDGLSNLDSNKIYQNFISTHSFWGIESAKRKNLNIIETFSDIYATKVITGRMIRKLQNFCDVYDSNLVMPFASSRIKNFFEELPLNLIYSEKPNRNKVFLRELLKNKLDLDSDKIGKMGWTYDVSGIIVSNLTWVKSEILECKLWDSKQTVIVLNRFLVTAKSKNKYSKFSAKMIYRIFLISLWYNHNQFINR